MNDIFSKFAGQECWDELLEQFVVQLPQRRAALDHAISANDLRSVSVLVHQLKGACGSYGFDELTPLADQLERALLKAPSCNSFPEELAIFLDALQRMTYRCPADDLFL